MKPFIDPISGQTIDPDPLVVCDLVVGKQACQVNPSMLSHFTMLLQANPHCFGIITAAYNTACVASWFRVQPRRVTPLMRDLLARDEPWHLDRKAQDAWVQAHREEA